MDERNPMEESLCIETELKDILTLNSCTTLVSELIKFILYRKQQLPYTFDRLKYLITRRKAKENQERMSVSGSASSERHFKVAEDGLTTLELIFEKTKEELANSEGCIDEIALLFGSTPMTPKQVYRIHLPEISLTHSSANHPERNHLIHLLQSVIHSNSLYNFLRKPMNLTNMFVFIKKTNQNKGEIRSRMSEWFVPKNRYEIPKMGQHFHLKFRHPTRHVRTCGCESFKIFSDEEILEKENSNGSAEDSDEQTRDTTWYQACAIFKGFTDVYVNGVSVADSWLR